MSGVDTDVFRVHSAHSATVFSTKKLKASILTKALQLLPRTLPAEARLKYNALTARGKAIYVRAKVFLLHASVKYHGDSAEFATCIFVFR